VNTTTTDEVNTTETLQGLEIYENAQTAGQHSIALSYIENGADWTPSYNFEMGSSLSGNGQLDALAQVANNAGEDWNSTTLSLAVGSPYFVEGNTNPPVPIYNGLARSAGAYEMAVPSAAPAFSGSAVGAQYIYTLSEPVTILNGETASLNLFTASAPYERYNLWDSYGDVQQAVDIQNEAGKPLAAGVVRVYESGVFAGEANIGYVGEGSSAEATFAAVPQLNVTKETNQTTDMPSSNSTVTTYSVALQVGSSANDTEPLTLRDYMDSGDQVQLVSSNYPVTQLSGGELEWKVNVPAGQNMTVSYVYKVTDFQQLPIYYGMAPAGAISGSEGAASSPGTVAEPSSIPVSAPAVAVPPSAPE
jgi:hypothetical protein